MITSQSHQYGILLPHFGSHASRSRLLDVSQEIEDLGFDSLWVRDHLVYHPHPHEDQNRIHIDSFVTLSAVAAVTNHIALGTSVLIPHRHPVYTAQLFSSLSFIAGSGRVEAGIGAGGHEHEFTVVGQGDWDRREVVAEQVEILRQLWSGASASYSGKYYSFDDVQLLPRPAGPIPVWYGGNSPAAVRRAVEYCDGWLPGRMPRHIYRERIGRMRRLAAKAAKPMPRAGMLPTVSIADTVEQAMSRLDVANLVEEVNRLWSGAPDSPILGPSELDGVVYAGPPEQIIREIERDHAEGAQVIIFDLRAQFDDYENVVEVIGREILGPLRNR